MGEELRRRLKPWSLTWMRDGRQMASRPLRYHLRSEKRELAFARLFGLMMRPCCMRDGGGRGSKGKSRPSNAAVRLSSSSSSVSASARFRK